MSRRRLLLATGGSGPTNPPDPIPTDPADEVGQWTTPVSDPETATLGYTIPTGDPYNVPDWMDLPTQGGNHESVHPSVIDFHPNTWNGHRYWMGITGYVGGLNRGENPHIFYSDNGFDWVLPSGVPAPLIESPGTVSNPDQPFNSDTELVFNAADNTLHLFYRVTQELDPTYEQVWRISSSNGTAWSDPVLAIGFEGMGPTNCASPTVVRIPGVGWRMWAVKGLGDSLRYWNAPSITGPWTLGGTCTMTGTSHALWHVQVVRYGNRLYMAGDGFEDDGIFPAISDDWGLTWTRGPNFIVTATYPWDNRPYRASLFLHPGLDKFRLWYSAQGFGGWRTGYTHVPKSRWDSLAD